MKKVPLRQCIGCREMKPKAELVRVVKSPEGNVSVDTTGRQNGRGAYVCKQQACLDRAVKSRALERTFKMKIESDVYNALRIPENGGDADGG